MKELLDNPESIVDIPTDKWGMKGTRKTQTLFHKDGLWVKDISYNEYKERDGMTTVYKSNGETVLIWYSKGIKKNVEVYNRNGNIKKEIPYRNSIKCGIEKRYDQRGRLRLEIPYENGLKQGIERRYDEDGNLVLKTRYDNDEKDLDYEESFCPYEDNSII